MVALVSCYLLWHQSTPGVEHAVALLINTELWGFVTPETVNIDDVKTTTAVSQPYYAVPTKYRKMHEFPKTA